MDINTTKIEINGHELEIDFLDAEVLDAYEDACAVLQQRGAEMKQMRYERPSDGLRAQCAALEEFIDAILGEGTSEKVFDGVRGNLRNHAAAVDKIIEATKSSAKEINDMNNRQAQRMVAQAKKQQAHDFRVYAGQIKGGRNGGKKRH